MEGDGQSPGGGLLTLWIASVEAFVQQAHALALVEDEARRAISPPLPLWTLHGGPLCILTCLSSWSL